MKNKLLCIIFVLLLAAGVYVQFSPADKVSIESENRKITAMPEANAKSITSGKFMKEFESHINDTVGFRSYFIKATDTIKSSGGIEPPKGKVLYTEKDNSSQSSTVPNLTGMSISEANRTAVNAGYNIKVSGAALNSEVVSYRQSIEAGTKAELGTTITVYFKTTTGVQDD